VTNARFVIFAADQTNSANRNAGFTRNRWRGATDMDTADLFNGLFFVYLVGGAMAFFFYALFRSIKSK